MEFTRLKLLLSLLVASGAIWLVLYYLERSYRAEGENYSLIEEGLFMGGDVQEPPRGTRAVLNLCEQNDPY
jgi:hypothetical protein